MQSAPTPQATESAATKAAEAATTTAPSSLKYSDSNAANPFSGEFRCPDKILNFFHDGERYVLKFACVKIAAGLGICGLANWKPSH